MLSTIIASVASTAATATAFFSFEGYKREKKRQEIFKTLVKEKFPYANWERKHSRFGLVVLSYDYYYFATALQANSDSEGNPEYYTKMQNNRKFLYSSPEEVKSYVGWLKELSHPHLHTPTDLSINKNDFYLYYPYIEQVSLDHLIQPHKPWSLSEVYTLFSHVCSALSILHQNGEPHEDLSSKNIIRVWEDGRYLYKIKNFRLRFNRTKMTTCGRKKELLDDIDLAFYPPETIKSSKKHSVFSDQYILASIVFYALSGKYCFYPQPYSPDKVDKNRRNYHIAWMISKFEDAATKTRTSLLSVRPDIPKKICIVIDRMLSVDPLNRFSSINEAHRAFHLAFDEMSEN